MQLFFIGCEYSGTTTLSRKLDEWLVENIGDQFQFAECFHELHVSGPE